jgi:hypothetical protein
MRRYISTFILGAMLATPFAAIAKDEHPRRYYDTDRRDYHEWNDREAQAYRHWVEKERHEKYRDWNHANKNQQREYWRWRHDHPGDNWRM